jgi:HSP20 family molecular chaperone IbpA
MTWMIPSSFQSIFSSLAQHDREEKAVSREKTTPLPSQQSNAPVQKTGVGQVALDIFEFDQYYILKAPIAGVKLSDLDIDIQDNRITIRGSRKQTDAVPEGKYYLQECFWGDFERSVTLPCSIDPKRVKATFNKESILKIIIPKEEEKIKIIRIND